MALATPTFGLASSKWNSHVDSTTCIFRLLEIPEPCYPPTFDKSKDVKTTIYKAKGNALLNMTEFKTKDYKEDLLTEYHASLLVTLRGICSDDSIAKMEKGDPGFTESLKDLVWALRLFSFSQDSIIEVLPQKSASQDLPAVGDPSMQDNSSECTLLTDQVVVPEGSRDEGDSAEKTPDNQQD
ncbi:hypothetical protein O6H91_13G047000 [Diphasiastrum complanatum]|nr:hypothetical protein O6H91_13G047000 [Diphasiastrum complanatum]